MFGATYTGVVINTRIFFVLSCCLCLAFVFVFCVFLLFLFFLFFVFVYFVLALPAGIYTTSQPGSIKYISNLCQSKAVFVDTISSLKKYVPIMSEISTIDTIIVFRDPIIDKNLIDQFSQHNIKLLTFSEFLRQGKAEEERESLNNELDKRKKAQLATQCCNIVYTSGTTGFSKAVMLSHDNLFFELLTLHLSGTFDYSGGIKIVNGSEERVVAYLPLSHIAGQVIYIFYPIYGMAQYSLNVKCFFARYTWKQTLRDTILYARPTNFVGVPRIWEKFYEAMMAGLAKASRLVFICLLECFLFL